MPPKFERPNIAKDNAEFRSALKQITRVRLEKAYEFTLAEVAKRRTLPLAHVVDFGTYSGDFLHYELSIGQQVTSIDIQESKLEEARLRPELQEALASNRLHLIHGRAQDIGVLPTGLADMLFVFEVFGAGFIGTAEDVYAVFENINHVTKPGGLCALTVRSRSIDELLAGVVNIDSFDADEVRLHRRHITPLLRDQFGGTIDWYGSVTTPLGGKPSFEVTITSDPDFTGHSTWDKNAFEFRKIEDLTKERPVYWLGIWEKPLSTQK